MKRVLGSLVLTVVMVQPATAWFGRRSQNESETSTSRVAAVSTQSRSSVAVFTEQEEQDFIRQIAARYQDLESAGVMQRVLAEKEVEAAEWVRRLQSEYGYTEYSQHRYAPEEMTLYREGVSSNDQRVAAFHFADNAELQAFRKSILARNTCMNQVHALQELIAEKEQHANEISGYLRVTYGIDPEKVYRYEKESRTLYLQESSEKPDSDS